MQEHKDGEDDRPHEETVRDGVHWMCVVRAVQGEVRFQIDQLLRHGFGIEIERECVGTENRKVERSLLILF